MALQFLLNLLIAFLWMAINNDGSGSSFIAGYVIGIILLLILTKSLARTRPFYLIRIWAILKLLLIFARELTVSNFVVIGHIIRPKLAIRPGIFAYETALTSAWEVTLLSCLICLTPGTLTLDVSKDGRTLYIHAIDIKDAELLVAQIRGTFEQAIMEVTR
ncbi:monovalent cation/H+ antiporter subunit E [Paenibacillus sp. FSL P4-0081]|jgi:multicomponent Na+:H+ antiporter subunit E|uniref:Na+/H+ antiporter subunit E n=1 Tax=Paenibacillus TaxID=44249 RepID=UPI0004F60D21|nr:Na+/H+ antiporter subunit E [Paenibacillus sp. FSL P4-0081]AIQ31341.1 monovalent cation/H+ antiporter subunit E [Paenibacillus sp. FSL P4-0081]